MRQTRSSTAITPPRGAAVALAVALVAVGAGSGCPTANTRVMGQPAAAAPELVGDEAPADVERKWGPPDRSTEFVDAATGRKYTIWHYDRFLDTNGSRLTTSVAFNGGRVSKVDRVAVPSAPTGQGTVRDSASRRDME